MKEENWMQDKWYMCDTGVNTCSWLNLAKVYSTINVKLIGKKIKLKKSWKKKRNYQWND